MGRDKAEIAYHGMPESERVAKLLATVCMEVHESIAFGSEPAPGLLVDLEADLGPIAGLRAAFAYRSDVAWLVLACDMPRFSKEAMDQLLSARSPGQAATAFVATDGEPHPLAAIYEPAVAAIVGEAASPRSLLKQVDAALVRAADPQWLCSVDSPADANDFLGSP